MRISTAELKKVPYLDIKSVGNRTINIVPLWDGNEWHVWIPQADGTLLKMRPRDSTHSDYVAAQPARDDDLHLPFLEFMWKHASWPDVAVRVRALSEDVHNLAASMAKIDHAFACRKTIGPGVTKFVATEVEYVFGVCRSLFDLLQEIIAAVWERIELLDPELQRSKRKLPSSFAKMALRGEHPIESDEISAKYQLPPAIASFFTVHVNFFKALRRYRNDVVHGLAGQQLIFDTPRGFGLPAWGNPFDEMIEWKDEDRYNERVVSLRPVLGHVICNTIYACNGFTDVISKNIAFPPDVAPGYGYFMRSYHNAALLAVQDVHRRKANPWWTLPGSPD